MQDAPIRSVHQNRKHISLASSSQWICAEHITFHHGIDRTMRNWLSYSQEMTHKPHIQLSDHDNQQSSDEPSTSTDHLLVLAAAVVMISQPSGVVNKAAEFQHDSH